MCEYFAVLRVAASSAADPASRAAAATYESANRQMTVTSQVSGFPASQGIRERPSGRFPSDRLRPSGSLVHGMPAKTIARATKLFRAWCLVGQPGAFLQLLLLLLLLAHQHKACRQLKIKQEMTAGGD